MDMRIANRIVSFVVPLVLLGAVGYASWVFCALLCTDYLIKTKHRDGLAAGLLTGYGILFVLFIFPYLRTFFTINLTPGYIEKGPRLEGDAHSHHHYPKHTKSCHWESKSTARKKAAREAREAADLEKGKNGERHVAGLSSGGVNGDGTPGSTTAGTTSSGSGSTQSTQATPHMPGPRSHNMVGTPGHPAMPITYGGTSHYNPAYPRRPVGAADHEKPKNLKDFWTRDVFVCENDGLPRWCMHCNLWKPDRSHHCSEVGHCVRKMDHVCPWVGGVVGAASYKFFVQTVFYGALYTIYMVVCLATFVGDRISTMPTIDKNWIAVLVISAAFAFFSLGMTLSTIQLMSKNISTIENLDAKSKSYRLAIYDPSLSGQSQEPQPNPSQPSASPVTQITYPLGKSHPHYDPDDLLLSVPTRTFRVIETEAGENPFQLRSKYDNIAEVMGYSMWEWWLPLTRSPVEKRGWSRYNEALIAQMLSHRKALVHEDV